MVEFVVSDADFPGFVRVRVEKDGDIVAGCRTARVDAERARSFFRLGLHLGREGEEVKFTDLNNAEKGGA